MNSVHYKNNIYKNGEYAPSHSTQMENERKRSKVPGLKQVQYRDDLWKFCCEKKIVREDDFKIGRTKQAIQANIRQLMGVIRKHQMIDEFVNRSREE